MPDDVSPNPLPDDGADPDPADAELVAYLDGELDPATARRIEARLAADPRLRARAASLKRSFDLLDFLPKPEPSPAFATRTLDRLPAVKSSAAVVPVAAPAAPSGPVPAPAASGTGTLALSGFTAGPVPASRAWPWVVGFMLLVAASLGGGYLGTAAVRTYLFPAPPPPEPTADSLPLTDLRVIELLPLYAPADDLEFVEKLADADRVGEDAAPAAVAEAEKPDGKEMDTLQRAFRDLPPDRQEKIRQLDQRLHALPPAQQARLLRALEGYAAWLHRLPDGERKKVLAATTADDRLAAIEDVRRGQWVAALPAAYRQKLGNLVAKDRADLIAAWKAEEDARRDGWATARFHWDFVRTGRQPWPFADEGMRKQVLDFVRAAYHPGDPKRNRLTPPDLARFNEAVERAEKGGEWVWLGKTVFDFSRNPRYEMYPEAAPGGKMVTDIADLQLQPVREAMTRRLANKAGAEVVGRWPDFALAVHREFPKAKVVAKGVDLHLGPARPGEFREDVQRFIPELQKKATPAEWHALKEKEGRWPDYPADLLKLARGHDLSVPGAMLPGPPSQWDQAYSLPPRPLPKP